MKILLQKTSLLDYPGRVSSVFFFPGCNLRCPWCHNRELVLGGDNESFIPLEKGLAHIIRRRNHIGGVVLSGGEPCLYKGLPDIIAEIKKIPLPVMLDTNGTFTAMLEELFRRAETSPDYIALDLKIAPARYNELAAGGENLYAQGMENEPRKPAISTLGENLIKSAALINSSGIEHEYRSLALPGGYFSKKDIEALAPLTDNAPWYFRSFRGGNCLDPAWDSRDLSMEITVKENTKTSGTYANDLTKNLAETARNLGKNGISP